ncbi:hypothetical protein EDD15DRAFT_830920 [Pisolithus albus]|nr:hypothetical protein EDD15DRAFT_830920 [Pisolithus albus]
MFKRGIRLVRKSTFSLRCPSAMSERKYSCERLLLPFPSGLDLGYPVPQSSVILSISFLIFRPVLFSISHPCKYTYSDAIYTRLTDRYILYRISSFSDSLSHGTLSWESVNNQWSGSDGAQGHLLHSHWARRTLEVVARMSTSPAGRINTDHQVNAC